MCVCGRGGGDKGERGERAEIRKRERERERERERIQTKRHAGKNG